MSIRVPCDEPRVASAVSADGSPIGRRGAGRSASGSTSPNGTASAAWSFRDGEKVELQSKSGQPLTRYFPEIVAAVAALKPQRFVLDGEIVVPKDGAFSFDALLQRIHPAASRIARLAAETPALLIVFDLLAGARRQSR